jgi:Holliday junction resolvase-like predicted endonuclease|tara:strand:- start:334 stop:1269 length:936 start_codon:yes stop_codon:yes gene_type:complete
MNKFLKYSQREPLPNERKISYSQFSMYSQCPKHWELAYAKNLRTFSQSIHTIFGTAMHETMQNYLTVMYDQSAKAADEIDINKYLKDQMFNLYKEAVEKMGEHFSNKFELGEFYEDGVAILDWFKRKRGQYFSRKNEELIGIEVPIYHPVADNNDKIMMLGYLDIVMRDKRTDKITIIDIKTSTRGWNKYQKADKNKVSQLVLYKKYFAEQYGYDPEKIDIKYMIVKRKLIDGAMFPQKRITEFSPASGKPTRNKLARSINEFVSSSFKADGSFNLDREYPAVAGKNNKNCKYCEFKDQPDLCPAKNRIKV